MRCVVVGCLPTSFTHLLAADVATLLSFHGPALETGTLLVKGLRPPPGAQPYIQALLRTSTTDYFPGTNSLRIQLLSTLTVLLPATEQATIQALAESCSTTMHNVGALFTSVFVDKAHQRYNAHTDARMAIKVLRDRLRQHPGTLLLVASPERLGRNIQEINQLIDQCVGWGTTIATVQLRGWYVGVGVA